MYAVRIQIILRGLKKHNKHPWLMLKNIMRPYATANEVRLNACGRKNIFI